MNTTETAPPGSLHPVVRHQHMKEIKDKIIEYLEAGQPVVKRRAWWNVARGIGLPKDERVRAALDELRAEKRIYRMSIGKGHCYAVNHVVTIA